MKDLTQIREEIDEIDNELLELFQKRMDRVLEVANYKKKHNIEVLNKKRESEIIKNHLNKLNDNKYVCEIEKFLTSMMEISRHTQRKMILNDDNITSLENEGINITENTVVGFQGVHGAYSEEALLSYFGDNIKTKNYRHFDDVFEGIKKGEIDYGVIPIENSSTGGVLEVYDLLNKFEFSITKEISLKINHCLIGIKGSNIDDITEVYSHNQGISQCSDFIKEKGLNSISYENTAKSAELIKEKNQKNIGCIGSFRAANIYELDVLKENINNNKNNTTRFFIISKKENISYENDKISIIFSIDNKVGGLYRVLKYFSENDVNMMKIESRPSGEKPWEYIFYVDIEGNIMDSKVKICLESIKDNTNYFRVIGNYKKSEDDRVTLIKGID